MQNQFRGLVSYYLFETLIESDASRAIPIERYNRTRRDITQGLQFRAEYA
jgi:hypothetical protein